MTKPTPIILDESFSTLASSESVHVVAISSFSKVFSIPGFRTGYALAHEAVTTKLALSNSTLYSCLPAFTQLGCLADWGSWTNTLRRFGLAARA